MWSLAPLAHFEPMDLFFAWKIGNSRQVTVVGVSRESVDVHQEDNEHSAVSPVNFRFRFFLRPRLPSAHLGCVEVVPRVVGGRIRPAVFDVVDARKKAPRLTRTRSRLQFNLWLLIEIE